MILLGMSGKKQSGKDTCAEMIRDHLHDSPKHLYVRLAFADALYEEVAEFLIMQDRQDGINKFCALTPNAIASKVCDIKANKPDYRLLLQWWGTDYRRKQDADYWIKRWLDKFRALPDNSFVVVPDVRFTNEFETIKKLNGLVWRTEREMPGFDTHPSECELDDVVFDYLFDNNFSLEHLRMSVEKQTKQITTNYQ